jgi:Late exocytosis, associated with Golgi transport
MDNQLLPFLLKKNNSNHDGGFFDTPGNPIQSNPSSSLFPDPRSYLVICYVSNRYCCSTWIICILDVLRIKNEMVTFLYGPYSPTRYMPTLWANTNIFLIGSKVPTLSEGLFSWIPQLWRVTDDQVLEAAGLDAYVVCPDSCEINNSSSSASSKCQ